MCMASASASALASIVHYSYSDAPAWPPPEMLAVSRLENGHGRAASVWPVAPWPRRRPLPRSRESRGCDRGP